MRENFTSVTQLRPAAACRSWPTGGSIVNITSIEAHRAAPNFAVYSAMKAGVAEPHRSRSRSSSVTG